MPLWLRNASDWIGFVGNFLALGAYFYGFVALMRARSSYLRRKRTLEAISAEGTGALVIGVGKDIASEVQAFLEKNHPGVGIVFSFHQPGSVAPRDLAFLIHRIRDQLQSSVDAASLHRALLFYSGPYAVAVALGAVFDNWIPVEVFQYDMDGHTYVHTVTLNRETVKGVPPM